MLCRECVQGQAVSRFSENFLGIERLFVEKSRWIGKGSETWAYILE